MVYQTEAGIGNPEKQMSFGNRQVPQQKEAVRRRKKKEREKMRRQEKRGQNRPSVERNRKKETEDYKGFSLERKKKKKAIRDFWEGNGFTFEYEMDNKPGIIPGNEMETSIFTKRKKMPITSFWTKTNTLALRNCQDRIPKSYGRKRTETIGTSFRGHRKN